MRIPNTGEFLAIFAATGQLSDFSKLQGADSELSLLAPQCKEQYKVRQGDICNAIAKSHDVPTYQIICGNDQINGKCTNLQIGNEICLARQGEDCRGHTFQTKPPYTNAVAISELFDITFEVFARNNYCVPVGPGGRWACPSFESVLACVAKEPIGNLPPCEKVLVV